MNKGPDSPDRRSFLKFTGVAAAAGAGLAAGSEARAQPRPDQLGVVPESQVNLELPPHIKATELFADDFAHFFSSLPPGPILPEAFQEINSKVNEYLKAFAVARRVNPESRSPGFDSAVLEFGITALKPRPQVDPRALGILESWQREARLAEEEAKLSGQSKKGYFLSDPNRT